MATYDGIKAILEEDNYMVKRIKKNKNKRENEPQRKKKKDLRKIKKDLKKIKNLFFKLPHNSLSWKNTSYCFAIF